MTTMIMSMSEIVRVGAWSLRALGFPFGTAERAVRLLAWSEAAHGQAVRMLRVAETEITASSRLPQAARTREAGGGWSIEAGGKHLLEVGGPAIDLATADARTGGTGHMTIRGAIGTWLVPALCDLAVRRSLAIVAVYASSAGETLPATFGSSGWIAGIGVATEPRFLAGPLEAGGAGIVPALRQSPLPASEAVASAVMTDAATATTRGADSAGHIGISVWAGTPALRPWPGTLPVADYPGRLARAYREGVEVDTIDCEHLYALERRTWAPTSERSRSQAGFGKYGDAKG
jgi:hypothetical protein